jgi:hypothetical protein
MAPLLGHGDEILVDHADGADRLRDGIYVLRREDALLVKRLSRHPRLRPHLDRQRQSRLSKLARLRSRVDRHRRPSALGGQADRLIGSASRHQSSRASAAPIPPPRRRPALGCPERYSDHRAHDQAEVIRNPPAWRGFGFGAVMTGAMPASARRSPQLW